VTTVTNVVGFLIAVLIFRDIVAVAAAFVLRGYLLLPLNLVWMRQYAGIPIREHLLELKGVAAATAVMAIAVLLVKLALVGHVHAGVLLLVEVLVGAAVFAVALLIFERALVAEIVAVLGQALPGVRRLARLLHLPTAPPGGTKARPADDSVEAEIEAGAEVDPTGLADEDSQKNPLV
jgi:hypothetical protein